MCSHRSQRIIGALSAFCFVLCAFYFVLPTSPVLAQVPHLVRYQGQAVDNKGVPLEGPYTLTFRLYDAATGGAKLWEEQQTGIPLSGGYFSVLLGEKTSLATMDWSQPRWLSVQVNTDPELTPRQQITSVPLAVRAETAEIVKTSGLTDDTNRLMPSGGIILWDGAACPAGYARLSTYDDRFLMASATAGTPGGSITHTHDPGSYAGPSHTHTVSSHQHELPLGFSSSGIHVDSTFGTGAADADWPVAIGGGGPNPTNVTRVLSKPDGGGATGAQGTGAITGTSAATNHLPPYRTILLCKKT